MDIRTQLAIFLAIKINVSWGNFIGVGQYRGISGGRLEITKVNIYIRLSKLRLRKRSLTWNWAG